MEQEQTKIPFIELIYQTCLICKNDFKAPKTNESVIQLLEQSGYCSKCVLLCKYCERKIKDPNNKLGFCYQCHEEYLDDESSSCSDSYSSTITDDIVENEVKLVLEYLVSEVEGIVDGSLIIEGILRNL